MNIFQNCRGGVMAFCLPWGVLVRRATALAILGLFLAIPAVAGADEEKEQFDPVGLFLTWQRDPTTTMTIDWHTEPAQGERDSVVQYTIDGVDGWQEAKGDVRPFPFSDRLVHRVELKGLKPDTQYRFRFGEDSKSYLFRTMPATLDRPLRFINGGDTLPNERFLRMNKVARGYDPAFIVWGGDLAYCDGNPRKVGSWYAWFDGIKNTLVHEDGRVIPIIVTIGNHEIFRHEGSVRLAVQAGMSEEEAKEFFAGHGLSGGEAPYYFTLMAFPGYPSYNTLDFGDYLSLIALDSEHYSPIEGEQTEWLAKALAERKGRPHIFPFYHYPAYPSAKGFTRGAARKIRQNWSPLFEANGVRVALEHDNHTYKRTHPILAGEINPKGILYVGDGSWGVNTRQRARSEEQDHFIDKFSESCHGIVITLDGNNQHFLVVDEFGEIIDQFEPPAR
jgi:hypothetical protein